MTVEQLFAEFGPRQLITRADYEALYGAHARAEGPVGRALAEAYRMAGTAGTDDTLKRLLNSRVSDMGSGRRRRRRSATPDRHTRDPPR